MNIVLSNGWNDRGNHDSFRTEEDVLALIRQIRNLPGLAAQNYDGVPRMIQIFAQRCIHMKDEVTVEKGIHQRWGNAAKPHIRISIGYFEGSVKRRKDYHVDLSEEICPFSGKYRWKTVGLSYVLAGKVKEVWPQEYEQVVEHIQEAADGRLKRRSIGCIQPDFAAPTR